MTQWSEWKRYPEVPTLGDYVQLVSNCLCSKTQTDEGLVVEIDEEGISLAPLQELNLCFPAIDKWRRREGGDECELEVRQSEYA